MSATINAAAWRVVYDALHSAEISTTVRLELLQKLYKGLTVDPDPSSPESPPTSRGEAIIAGLLPMASEISEAAIRSLRKFDKRVARLTIALEKIAAATTRETAH